MTWTAITASQTDADSPIDEDLMDAIRTNLDHIFDGTDISTDLVTQDSIAASAVGQGELKTTTTTASLAVSASSGGTTANFGVSGFGFYPRERTDNGSATGSVYTCQPLLSASNPGTSYGDFVYLGYSGTPSIAHNFYSQIVYVQASEEQPFLGLSDAPGFLYTKHKPGGELHSSWFSLEAPWYVPAMRKWGRLAFRLADDAPDLMPQPFFDVPDGWEVRCYDLRHLHGPGDYRPKADRLERNRAALEAHANGAGERAQRARILLGILEAEAQDEAETAQAAAEDLLATKVEMQRVTAEIDSMNIPTGKAQLLKAKARWKHRARWFALREKANAMRTVEAEHQREVVQGRDLLEAVLSRRIPVLDTHTHSVSDDKSHADYAYLPESFRKRTGRPFVRFMVAP